jgi:type IV fimbrial biogenesis protein FimT
MIALGKTGMSKNSHIASQAAVRGMTIIEMMLTLGIVGVLVALAVPSFTTVVQNSRIRSQASDVMANLAIARAEAAKRGQRVTLCPVPSVSVATPVCTPSATGWKDGYIVFADANGNGAYEAGEVLIAVSEKLSGGNTLTSTGFTGNNAAGTAITNELQFRASGTTNLPAAGGSFKLCDSRTTGTPGRTISIGVTGRALSTQVACP